MFNVVVFFPFKVNFAVRKHVKGQDDNEQIKRFITYTFEQHVRDHTGQKIVLFFDMSNAGLGNLVSHLFKFQKSFHLFIHLVGL